MAKMWLYPRPTCPDRPFSEKLGNVEINTRIHEVLDHGADLNPEVAPTHLGERDANTRVSLFRSIFGSLHDFILSSCSLVYAGSWVRSQHTAGCQLARGLGKAGSEPCPLQ
jgi:hypothetical protein